MGRQGGGGIKFGSIELYSQTETIEEMRKQLELILSRIGYPSWVDRADNDVSSDENVPGEDDSDIEELTDDQSGVEGEEPVVEEVPVKSAPWMRMKEKKSG